MGLENEHIDDLDFEHGNEDEMLEEQLIDYDEIKSQTGKAILFKFGDKEVWLPKSQIKMKPGSKAVLVPNWLCFENELI